MKPKKWRGRSSVEEVELVGVPHYAQGEADSLCVYYAMSMLLAALHPEWRLTMHDKPRYKRGGSPVFQGLRRVYRSKTAFELKVADWVFRGMSMGEATRILNRYFQELKGGKLNYFTRHKVRARRIHKLKYSRRRHALGKVWTANDILHSLSWYLPVIISGGGLGAHAVVAFGYSARGSADRLIGYLDPSSLRPEWRPIGEILTGDAEVIAPNGTLFVDYRPGRVKRDAGGTTFDLWEKDTLKLRD